MKKAKVFTKGFAVCFDEIGIVCTEGRIDYKDDSFAIFENKVGANRFTKLLEEGGLKPKIIECEIRLKNVENQ